MTDTSLQPFDYGTLATDTLPQLHELAERGRSHLRRSMEEILAFGEVLLQAKALLPHGTFRAWTQHEFHVPDSTVTYAMKKASTQYTEIKEIENVNINILPEPFYGIPSTDKEKYEKAKEDDAQFDVVAKRMRDSVIDMLTFQLEIATIIKNSGGTSEQVYQDFKQSNVDRASISAIDYGRFMTYAEVYKGRYETIPQETMFDIAFLFAPSYDKVKDK